jgi:hypothetical protein
MPRLGGTRVKRLVPPNANPKFAVERVSTAGK